MENRYLEKIAGWGSASLGAAKDLVTKNPFKQIGVHARTLMDAPKVEYFKKIGIKSKYEHAELLKTPDHIHVLASKARRGKGTPIDLDKYKKAMGDLNESKKKSIITAGAGAYGTNKLIGKMNENHQDNQEYYQ